MINLTNTIKYKFAQIIGLYTKQLVKFEAMAYAFYRKLSSLLVNLLHIATNLIPDILIGRVTIRQHGHLKHLFTQ